MRCPICDYDPELSLDHQSTYFSGLKFDVNPAPYLDQEGMIRCNCFSEFDEDDIGLTEDDDDQGDV